MNPGESPIVSRQPATLVVGDPDLAETVRVAVGGTVMPVEGYLMTLGEMAHRRVTAVIGGVETMGVSMEATVRGLRELAPNARLVLVVDAAHEPQAMRAVRLGFDDYLIRPVDAEELSRALESAAGSAEGAREPAGGPDASPEPPDALGLSALEEDPLAGGLADNGALTERSDQRFLEGMITGTPTPDSAEDPEAAGPDRLARGAAADEAELVDRLLRGQHDLRETALEAVRQRLGAPDVRWSVEPVEGARACVEVAYEWSRLGYLVSEGVGPESLRGEAEWIGRWVVLSRHIGALTEMAFRDELTGLRNRRYFDRFLRLVLERARAERFRVTLMVYDIDDFKSYNDRFGHEAGDEILRETARLMGSVVRRHDVVARIGGDEFAVIFWDAEPPRRKDSTHPQSVRTAAERFQRAVCEHRFPKLAEQAPGTLTISGGLASFPWDGQETEELHQAADRMLLESKRQGKNAITFGPGAVRACEVRGAIDEASPEG
jgi:diguanylate cyclase (GGDEF)-like protein